MTCGSGKSALITSMRTIDNEIWPADLGIAVSAAQSLAAYKFGHGSSRRSPVITIVAKLNPGTAVYRTLEPGSRF